MHNDEEQTKEMLGSHPDRRDPATIFGLPIKDAVLISGVLLTIGGGWTQLSTLNSKLSVEPAAIQEDVQNLTESLEGRFTKLENVIETTRRERNEELRDLQSRVARGEAERAGQAQKLNNLEDLMRDIRDLMRQREGGRADVGAQRKDG